MADPGYDAPIETVDDDVLRRVGFAREIADLATSAPRRWAIRIGIYGAWGTGKSSVLNLCRNFIEARGHVAADFSPWGYADSKEMLRGLATAAIDAIKTSGSAVEGGAARKLRGAADSIGKVTEAALGVAESVPGIETGAKVASHAARLVGPWLSRLLEADADSFAAIDRALGPKRLVVLIDDVDRADPSVLPPLLFALHEVMAQPGISYIVALDPTIVSDALANHHPGFGNGLSFLEKVIQFPRWLPEPSPVDLAALAQREAREFAPFIPPHVIRQNLGLLPMNPRALRSVLRNLWTVGHQAKRHDEDEFDPNLLLRIHLLRSEFPKLFREVALNADGLIELASSTSRRKAEDESARADKILKTVKVWVPQDRCEQAAKLLDALLREGTLWNTERVLYYALMVESPHAVTWKEFRSFMGEFTAQPAAATIEQWLARHARARETTEQQVAEEAFAIAARFHHIQMERAADSNDEESQDLPIRSALCAIELLDKMLFECPGSCSLTPDKFQLILGAFRSWAHFASAVYQDVRARERSLLMKCVNTAGEPGGLLEILAPWKPHSYFDEQQRTITNELVEALVPRVAASLEDVFSRPSGVGAVIESDVAADRWVLFHPERFWTADRVKSASRIMHESLTPIVGENCAQFLRKLVDDGMESGRWGFSLRAAQDILRHDDLIAALWRGASMKAVNVRYFSAFRDFRHALEQKLGHPLEDPPWWERLAAELRTVNARAADNAKAEEGSKEAAELGH